MFGIVYALTIAITNAVGHTKEYLDDLDGKKRGIQRRERNENPENVYFDHKGRIRDIQTNELRDIRRENGDLVLKDNNRNVLRNLSEEKREAEYQKRKNEAPSGTRAVFYKRWNMSDTPLIKDSVRITGEVYRDIHNNELYLTRYIHWNKDNLSEKEDTWYENGMVCSNGYGAEFYINPDTAEIVDVTDKWIKNNKNINIDDIHRFIKHFNSEQKKGGWKSLAREYGSVSALYCNS